MKHEPNRRLHLYGSSLSGALLDWAATMRNVVLEPPVGPEGAGWNIKPLIMKDLLKRLDRPVVWLDTDLILTAPIGQFVADLPSEALLLTPEPVATRRGVRRWTEAWGLATGRETPFSVNSCVLRVTDAHLPLLSAWEEALSDPLYRSAQSLPPPQRPFHLLGDQDALAALVGSRAFADLDVRALRLGRDIAQCRYEDGYGPLDRLRNFGRLPPLVHAQAQKPWRTFSKMPTYLEVSAYRIAAEPYRQQLPLEQQAWLQAGSARARVMRVLALGDAGMAGFLPALGKRTNRMGRAILRRIRASRVFM